MRKSARRKAEKPRPPMLVMRECVNKELETQELMAVHAFARGFATKKHFDLLMDMVNLLLLAGTASDETAYAQKYAEEVLIPMMNGVKARYDKTGKLGVSAAELSVMREMVEWSRQFWVRQPIELFHAAAEELRAFYVEVQNKRKELNCADGQ